MTPDQSSDVNPRILSLAAEVAESAEQNVPVLLLQLKEILQGVSARGKELKKLKQDLYDYDLIQYCVLVLKQDYCRIQGGWATAAQLAEILSNCCVGLNPEEEAEEFYSKVLPSAAENLLILARRLQARFTRAVKDEEKTDFFRSFRTVTDSICWLFGGHVQLTQQVMQSGHFLQLLLTDDVETEAVMMSVLQNIIRVNSVVLMKTDEKTVHAILDELVYKLSSSSNPVIGIAATKAMILIANHHQSILKSICNRYKGLRMLLSKQWSGKGFDRELGQLLELLYSRTYQQNQMQRLHHAACVIQAAWKAFQTRKRIKRLPKAVSSLQKSFRVKKEQQLLLLERQREEEELRHQLQLQRQRAIREFRQRQLHMLEIVPASLVDRHLREQELKAVVLIQKQWRGHRERKGFHLQKQALKQFKAAVTLQRAALRFLEKRRNARKVLPPWKGPQGLTDARRLELRKLVEEHIALHPAPLLSEQSSKELHLKCQEMLAQHLMKRHWHRKAEQRSDALRAQINTDIELLMNAPGLKAATEKELAVFTSRSAPVAARAKQTHTTMLQFTRWPWWKKLGDEFMDPENIPHDNLDIEFESLYLGGNEKV
ncbi:IQ calmodulin-binding motif-containing protein 1-like [Polyodon spathula]|uniref:IQ calmodulin-binding motif-containing protein 1-like n=1 Tax=Polyodon spathula TaxID=7913 RepID=UPI001B7E81BF|nr:IQ calmodulin-binding motif-containing protein 1-like [Polyodon spathula]